MKSKIQAFLNDLLELSKKHGIYIVMDYHLDISTLQNENGEVIAEGLQYRKDNGYEIH
jgi:hypothetical protein